MKRVIVIATASVTAMLLALTVSVAAQDFNKHDLTYMTFSNAVELPGMRLEPGTYIFRLEGQTKNLVQVLSEDKQELLGQWLYVPAERREVSGETVVTFRETSADSTPAVQFWYYPGEPIGKEFIYPKDQAMRIAQRTGATVLTEEGPVTAGAQASVQAESFPSPIQEDVAIAPGGVSGIGMPEQNQAEVVGTTGSTDPAPASGGSVQQESTYAQSDTRADTSAPSELPRTASPLPLSGLIALLSLAGAAGIRAFRP